MADAVVESGPTERECRALVARIVASEPFHRANRLRDFLVYVVDRKLADSPHEVTETIVGHRVFGRPAAYNTGEDSIVRTEARVLRQRLERYFSTEGADEPIVLEIPKGSYLPVFRLREQLPKPEVLQPVPVKPVKPRRWFSVWLVVGCSCIVIAALSWRLFFARAERQNPSPSTPLAAAGAIGSVVLESSDPQLVKGFEWAKQRALGYTYTGDPVGNWYDSVIGARNAFCMRDVSHQGVGAAVLGLTGHTRNMLHHFAASISSDRSWCGFWEINKDGFPAPIDYKDDRHFWYCLPANFDVMQAAYRQFLWTGDKDYFDAVFANFYDRSVTDYVDAWDHDRDGIMDSSPEVWPRGIPSYYQQQPRALVGGDLLAAQYKGYLVYAAIQHQQGAPGSRSEKLAEEYSAKAQALRVRYNTEWWDPVQNRHYSIMLPSHRFYSGYIDEANLFALLFGLTEDGLKTDAALDSLEKNKPSFDQKLSYFPEILFQYGRNDSAYRRLLDLTDPNFRSRGMPEIVFATIGAVATGLVGISPDAPEGIVETRSRLPKAVAWVKLDWVPVLENEIAVQHRGLTQTSITNRVGPAFQWKASFPVSSASLSLRILVDGVPVVSTVEQHTNHQLTLSAVVRVKPGQTRTATLH